MIISCITHSTTRAFARPRTVVAVSATDLSHLWSRMRTTITDRLLADYLLMHEGDPAPDRLAADGPQYARGMAKVPARSVPDPTGLLPHPGPGPEPHLS